jgi:hypothetical protein
MQAPGVMSPLRSVSPAVAMASRMPALHQRHWQDDQGMLLFVGRAEECHDAGRDEGALFACQAGTHILVTAAKRSASLHSSTLPALTSRQPSANSLRRVRPSRVHHARPVATRSTTPPRRHGGTWTFPTQSVHHRTRSKHQSMNERALARIGRPVQRFSQVYWPSCKRPMKTLPPALTSRTPCFQPRVTGLTPSLPVAYKA